MGFPYISISPFPSIDHRALILLPPTLLLFSSRLLALPPSYFPSTYRSHASLPHLCCKPRPIQQFGSFSFAVEGRTDPRCYGTVRYVGWAGPPRRRHLANVTPHFFSPSFSVRPCWDIYLDRRSDLYACSTQPERTEIYFDIPVSRPRLPHSTPLDLHAHPHDLRKPADSPTDGRTDGQTGGK